MKALQRWFWWLLLANIIFVVCADTLLRPLTYGEMVRFEIAKHIATAEGILLEWRQLGLLQKALYGVYFNFAFIGLYTAGLAVGCAYLSKLTGHEILIRAARAGTWLLVGAGICDIIGNTAMLNSLLHGVSHWNAMLAYDMAAARFSVIILSLLFMMICLVFWLGGRLADRDERMTF
ncbi:hypothetical protein [Paraflavitalea pollutisoli]|uniref:hypothetical protein n=1 Tax=Paraflavitalea pollutisoli TaxID=3034143 RepID=UPI0023EA7DBB|nr:hypothetical protein [Paraflavitalea sp. H1-2-19X]